ncbi:hypothetical protein HOD29_03995 [archaeon]|nr:hypothetical protein [archaeon]
MIGYLLLNKMGLLHAILGLIVVGVSLEVFWTSLFNGIKKKDLRFKGTSYLWMFPIYAIAVFIFLFVTGVFMDVSIWIRGIVYLILFTLLEFLSGIVIRKLVGKSPWDYTNYKIKIFEKIIKSNLKGVICLQYLPVWYIYGIFGELFFLFLIGI